MTELGAYPLTLEFAKSLCVNFDSVQQQFSAGRFCARAALRSNGCSRFDDVLLRDERGAPLWPKGYVGSITHTGGFAAAMVAMNSRVMSLGIDSEILIHRERAELILSEIVTPSEWAQLQKTCPDLAFEQLTMLCFSAKESIYKCVSPLLQKSFGFHSVELTHINPEQKTFQSRLLLEEGSSIPITSGKFEFAEGMVHTLAYSIGPRPRQI